MQMEIFWAWGVTDIQSNILGVWQLICLFGLLFFLFVLFSPRPHRNCIGHLKNRQQIWGGQAEPEVLHFHPTPYLRKTPTWDETV